MKRILRSSAIAGLLIILFQHPYYLFSQHKNFRSWSVREGLPQSDVYDIIQDHLGYIWMGTGSGAVRFDGKNFTSYSTKQGLAGNAVRSLLCDSKNRIWFGSDGGIALYDGIRFKRFGEKQNFKGSNALCILEDRQGIIWVGTDDGGLNKITQNADSFVLAQVTDPLIDGFALFDLFSDSHGNIWIASFGGGLIRLNPQDGSYDLSRFTSADGLPSDRIIALSSDHDHKLWIGTYDAGAARVDLSDKGKKISSLFKMSAEQGLASDVVWDIMVDSSNDVWISSTDKGITHLHKSGDQWNTKYYTPSEGLPGNQVLALFEDREQNLWVGTGGNGAGMLLGDRFSHYDKGDGLPANNVLSVSQDSSGNFWLAMADGGVASFAFSDGRILVKQYPDIQKAGTYSATCLAVGNRFNPNLWIGTSNGGLVKYDGQKFSQYTESDGLLSNRIYSIFVDSRGIVWIGTSNGISRFDGKVFLNSSSESMMMEDHGVKAITEDKKGNIWFGTAGGLARYSGDGTLRTFDEAEGLQHTDINSITSDRSSTIWIGTNAGGIYKYDPSRPDSASVLKVHGDSLLSSMSVRSLVFENDSVLIAGTFQGIDRITLRDGKIVSVRSYDASDGFIGVECNDNSILKDVNGDLWIGTVNGLTRYTGRVKAKLRTKPVVHINSMQLFFKDVDWHSKQIELLAYSGLPLKPVLKHNENHVTFRFTGLSYSNPLKLRYVYMLEGQDTDWSPLRSSNEATFSGLTKGNYRFLVKVMDAEGRWSEPAGFDFTILAPWYQTKLFYSSMTLLLLAGGFAFVRIRERKLIHEKNMLEKIVTERTKEVVLQKEHIAEKNKEITDSINYARRIQNAILPDLTDVYGTFGDVFILFKPKDIVSGDFYWLMKEQNLIAAADCTGHGVPGAFMSTIGVEKLNEASSHSSSPGIILSELNRALKKSLNQTVDSESNEKATRDGMDIALLKIDRNESGASVCFAGANRPLWILKNGAVEILEIKATKMAIGGLTGNEQSFAEHKVELDKGDTIYVFSDGYADQFRPGGKKLMTRKFKQLLVENQHLSMQEQDRFLSDFIDMWKGSAEQTDDILVIGIRI